MTAPLRKPVSREIDGIVVTIAREGLYVRERGRRQAYGPMPYGVLLLRAARDFVEITRAADGRKSERRVVARGRLSIGGIR